jgi:hypothetical protein
MVLRKGPTCTLSDESGVEGVAGEGEREVEAACEEEEDMITGERKEGGEDRERSNNLNQIKSGLLLSLKCDVPPPPSRLHNSFRETLSHLRPAHSYLCLSIRYYYI